MTNGTNVQCRLRVAQEKIILLKYMFTVDVKEKLKILQFLTIFGFVKYRYVIGIRNKTIIHMNSTLGIFQSVLT